MEANKDSAGQGKVMEWALFRKGDATSTPAEGRTYPTRDAAEKTRKKSYLHPEHWEVRGREIGPWDVKAREAVAPRG
jgi:hypothetical protein